MTIFIRSATERDLPAVSELLGLSWHETYDAIYGFERVDEITADWHSIASLKDNLTRPNSEFIVADDGEALGGMAFACSNTDDNTIMLHQIYVHPDKLGQGIGSMLLDEVVDCFPDARGVRLEVESANEYAIAFYKAKGFEQKGETANCGKADSGIPAMIFECRL